MTYMSVFKTLTRSKWRWPLVPFAAVALFLVFTATCVFDALFGVAYLSLLALALVLVFVAALVDPNMHAAMRKRLAEWIGEAMKTLARHPKVVATLRNPRWWIALPAWAVVVPPLITWAIVRGLCSAAADGLRWFDEKLHSLADAGVLRHMRRMYSWVFGMKS